MNKVSPTFLDPAPTASSCKDKLRAIESRVVNVSTAAADAETDELHLEFRRQYVIEAGKQLDELDCYTDIEPMEALRYLLGRVRRLVGEIDSNEFTGEQDKALVHEIQQKYDKLVLKLAKCLGTEIVSSVFDMFDLGNKEFTLRYYIAVMRCYDAKCNQGLFGANRAKKRLHEINEHYGLADHVAMIQMGARARDYREEIFPFLEAMMRSENLYDNGAVLDKTPDQLDVELRSLQTRLVKLRNQMFETGFYEDDPEKANFREE